MKWIQTKIVFEHNDKNLASELISNILFDFGIQGVEIESSERDETQDWADGVESIPERDSVCAYFSEQSANDETFNLLETALKELNEKQNIITRIYFREMDEEDWAESWKAYFWPEKIGEKIVVKPTWRNYTPQSEDEIILEIDPGMAFGTGTHPTTRLCVQMLESYLIPGISLLDVGCGSGILMVTAQKLGAADLEGVDMDPVAIDVSEHNLLLNNVPSDQFVLKAGNLVKQVDRKFDMVVANILSEVIIDLLDDISSVLKKGGLFVASGIITENRGNVVEKMISSGFDVLEVREQESWVAIAGRRN